MTHAAKMTLIIFSYRGTGGEADKTRKRREENSEGNEEERACFITVKEGGLWEQSQTFSADLQV